MPSALPFGWVLPAGSPDPAIRVGTPKRLATGFMRGCMVRVLRKAGVSAEGVLERLVTRHLAVGDFATPAKLEIQNNSRGRRG